jgi:hypothetical protein
MANSPCAGDSGPSACEDPPRVSDDLLGRGKRRLARQSGLELRGFAEDLLSAVLEHASSTTRLYRPPYACHSHRKCPMHATRKTRFPARVQGLCPPAAFDSPKKESYPSWLILAPDGCCRAVARTWSKSVYSPCILSVLSIPPLLLDLAAIRYR